ncbi:unnamed protein product [Lactuca saligna]|uniref:Uncharacterized protein n=1 Tax=Lactuca saligna TaxID=75948 RepID=A0AA36E4G9_LACSI|nr:unnamed protein product [Lactuca saligna]
MNFCAELKHRLRTKIKKISNFRRPPRLELFSVCLFSCDIVHTIKIVKRINSLVPLVEEGVGEETLLELELVDLKTRHLPQLQEVSTFGIRFPALRPPLCTNPFICNRVNYTNGPYCVG